MGLLATFWSGRFGSPDAVAVEMLKHWPPEVQPRPQPRTLGNQLRLADRGDAAWWLKSARHPVVRRLAKVLKLDEQELEQTLRTPGAPKHPALYKVAGLGGFKPLRLDQEELFPGLPPRVLASEQWTRHWWQVRDPVTRELVAQWHTHQGRTSVARSATWDEAVPDLPQSGRVLLILDAQVEPVRASLPERPGLFLCVMAPCPAQRAEARQPAWDAIQDLPPGAWIEDLAAWVRPRGHKLGGLRGNGKRLVECLAEHAHWFVGPRDALELCGLFEEIGFKSSTPRELAQRYVHLLWDRDEALAPRRSWLRDHGAASLVAVIEEALCRHGYAWLGGLSRTQWEGLAPASAYGRGAEQAHARLKNSRGPIDRSLREELLAALEPGPRFFIDDLCAAGILVKAVGDSLRIEPQWLSGCLCAAALEDIRNKPWESWVERLTQPVIVDDALQAMIADWAAGRFTRIDEILTCRATTALPYCIAVDICVRAAGLARLQVPGVELPRERLEALWEKVPLIVVPTGEGKLPAPRFSSPDETGMLGREVFAVSIVLLSELLPAGRGAPFEGLWKPGLDHDFAWTILNGVEAFFRRHMSQPSAWLDGLLRLGARWIERCGEFGRRNHLNDLILPAWLVAQFLGDAPSERAFRLLDKYTLSESVLTLMQRHCELHGIDFGRVAERCWRAWDPSATHQHRHPWLLRVWQQPDQAWLVWRHLPPDLITGALKDAFTVSPEGIYPNAWKLFGARQWDAWFSASIDCADDTLDRAVLYYMPVHILREQLRRGRLEKFDPDADEIIWSRMGDELVRELGALRQEAPKTAWRLVHSAPQPLREACLEAVSDWLNASPTDEQSAAALTYLEGLVATRSPLAPRAWAALRRAREIAGE